ncbi:hypothetical protein [Mycobacterium intracellulare]|uniref:hypothetical protein n=1 Tax=Mycobacterium intracellulare TaxID=1767 RepID=UPI001EEF1025|nr:hypothetical protein [Mycobacterium intracellulare]MEE3755224.1 hypothetical protein [Mycobacterium intracellulare]
MAQRRPRRITAADLGDYGSVIHRTVRVDTAAQRLGVSKSAVRKIIRDAQNDLSGKIFRMLSGRAEADFSATASPRGLLIAAYGPGPRGGAVDTTAAANDLGVAAETVRRWAAGRQHPSAEHLKALRRAALRSVNTRQGRRAATEALRRSAKIQKWLRADRPLIEIEGLQGPSDIQYATQRCIKVDFNPKENPNRLEDMINAYVDGGDQGFLEWLTEFVNDAYLENWVFFTIDDIRIGEQ